MTNKDKALVERLAAEADNFKVAREVDMRGMLYRAADRIEALSAENERLSDQLEYAVGELSKYRAKYMVGTSPILEEKSE